MITIPELKKRIEVLEIIKQNGLISSSLEAKGQIKILKEWLQEKEELERMFIDLKRISPLRMFDNFVKTEKAKGKKDFAYSDFAIYVRDLYLKELKAKLGVGK